MKLFRSLFLTVSLVAIALAGSLHLRADDPPAAAPAPAPAEVDKAAPASAPAVAPASSAAPAPEKAQAPAPEKSAPAPAATATAVPAETAAAPAAAPAPEAEKAKKPDASEDDDQDADVKVPGVTVSTSQGNSHDRVRVFDDVVVKAGTTVKGDAVAVMGDLTVNGEVMHDAVSVMGDNTINGRVHHDVVAVMGDLTLGPDAHVDGNAVSVGGEVHRDPGAKVGGEVRVKPIGEFRGISNVWDKTLRLGRPLAIGAHLGWLWILTGFSVAIYALLALLFPNTVRKCGDKLALEPGMTILAAVLSLIALPVLFILLCITIVGIPIALLLLPVALIVCVLFGKAAIYGLVGRRVTNDRVHLAVATIIGALIFVVMSLLPYVGILLSLLVALVGFGTVVLTMFGSRPKPAPAVARPAAVAPIVSAAAPTVAAAAATAAVVSAAPTESAAPAAPPVVEVTPPVLAAPGPAPAPAPAAAVAPPVTLPPAAAPAPVNLDALTLPRAGFWLRIGAAFLDFIMISIAVMLLAHTVVEHSGPGLIFFTLALYSAALWKARGSTVGGVICGLRVVRLDGRPIDWQIALVRALAGFLSFFAAGLGFIWVAFDSEKQSWHDKVAGTTIVRVPKGTSLL